MARGQGERLMPLLEELLGHAGLSWASLDGLAVGVGPGNFTGIRISVAAVRGLALGLDIPAIGISLFETTQLLSNRTHDTGWATAVPAPRDRFYLFAPDPDGDPMLVDSVTDSVPLSSAYTIEEHISQMAEMVGPRGSAREIARGEGEDITSMPKPLYIKPADAAPPRDAPPVLID